jgi:hypothetical protein
MRQRVLLASNCGPFSYWFGADGTLIGRLGGGGLITGMTPAVAAVAAQAEVIWICAAFTDADRAAARQWGAGSEDPAGHPGRPGHPDRRRCSRADARHPAGHLPPGDRADRDVLR